MENTEQLQKAFAIVADLWIEQMFKDNNQNNGDSFQSMIANIFGNKSRNELTMKEQLELRKYFKSELIQAQSEEFENNNYQDWKPSSIVTAVDYNPEGALANVSEKIRIVKSINIDLLLPIKSCVRIDGLRSGNIEINYRFGYQSDWKQIKFEEGCAIEVK